LVVLKAKPILYALNNSIPLLGAFVFGWDAVFIVQFCFIEVYIASLFDVLKYPFLKDNPNGEYGQGIITGYSIAILPFIFLISTLMVDIFEIHLAPWHEFFLPAMALAASYTVQLVHFFAVDRLNPNFYRSDAAKFNLLRSCILVGAMVLLPWVGLFIGSMGVDLKLADSIKGVILLMCVLRTWFEINISQSPDKQLPQDL